MTDLKQMPERIWAHRGSRPEQLGNQSWSEHDLSYGVFQQTEYIRADLAPQIDVEYTLGELFCVLKEEIGFRHPDTKAAVEEGFRRIITEAMRGQNDD